LLGNVHFTEPSHVKLRNSTAMTFWRRDSCSFNFTYKFEKSKFIELYIKNWKLCNLLLLGVACVFYRELHKPLAFSTFRAKFTKNLFVKELSFCHLLYFSNVYIFATQCRRPFMFQTMNSVRPNNRSLKYQRFISYII